jgi:hypothetical protein
MDTVRRGRGRPPGATFDSLDEHSKIEIVEEQLDRIVEQRAEMVARSSTDNGFEVDHDIAVRQFHERAAARRREEWASYHRAMHALHSSLAAEHEKKLQRLLLGSDTLPGGGE